MARERKIETDVISARLDVVDIAKITSYYIQKVNDSPRKGEVLKFGIMLAAQYLSANKLAPEVEPEVAAEYVSQVFPDIRVRGSRERIIQAVKHIYSQDEVDAEARRAIGRYNNDILITKGKQELVGVKNYQASKELEEVEYDSDDEIGRSIRKNYEDQLSDRARRRNELARMKKSSMTPKQMEEYKRIIKEDAMKAKTRDDSEKEKNAIAFKESQDEMFANFKFTLEEE